MSCAVWEASGTDYGSHNAAGCLARHATVPMRVPQDDGDDAVLDLDAAGVLAHLDDAAHPWDGVADTLMRRLLAAGICEGGVLEGDTSGEIARAFALVGLEHDLGAFGGFPAPGSYGQQAHATLRALRVIRGVRNSEESRYVQEQAKRHGGAR